MRLLVQMKTFDAKTQGLSPRHNAWDGSGWTVLMIASSLRDGDKPVDLFLSKGADVNAKNFSGQSALHFYASKNNLEVARTLIRHKASTRIKDKRDQLSIHRAAAVDLSLMTQLFIDHKSPLNATDSAGHTALHHAISEGHRDTAMLFLGAKAESNKQDTDGKLAIKLAPDQMECTRTALGIL
ncbi:MAG: hypothetical protein M1826_001306 [Phylliscum demangeonii]|nr:MAG: hypothetical protein M1826_001306 [Phylliscum demangeonii]